MARLLDPSAVPAWALQADGTPIPATDPRAAEAVAWCHPGDASWTPGPPAGCRAGAAKAAPAVAGSIFPADDAGARKRA